MIFKQMSQGTQKSDLYDPYDVVHVAWWEAYNLRGLGRVAWVGHITIQILHNVYLMTTR